MSKTIITGGLGFVGKHVVERLMQDIEVIVVDLPQKDVPDKFCSLPIEQVDITNAQAITSFFNSYKPEYVVHLAALANLGESEKSPSLTSRINIGGTLNVIEAAKSVGIKRFIFMSSAAVYGTPQEDVITENHPTNPTNNYGRSKLAAEMALLMYHDLDKIILRGANIYGPGQKNHCIPVFMDKILANQPPILNNNGDAIRDFVYVTDIADAIHKALTVRDHTDVYNLGTGEGVPIRLVWEYISKAAQQRGYSVPNPVLGQLAEEEVQCNVLSGKLARQSLGWQPKVNLEQGISRTVEAYLPERTTKPQCVAK